MPPPPNATCGFGRPADVEAERVGERALVAVRRRVEQHDAVAGRDRRTPPSSVSRVAVRAKSATGLAQRTISSVAVSQSVGSARSAARSVGSVEQRDQSVRDRVARRLAARDRQHEEEQVELELGEPHRLAVVVVDLGRREHAPHVVGGARRFSAPSSVAYWYSSICASIALASRSPP